MGWALERGCSSGQALDFGRGGLARERQADGFAEKKAIQYLGPLLTDQAKSPATLRCPIWSAQESSGRVEHGLVKYYHEISLPAQDFLCGERLLIMNEVTKGYVKLMDPSSHVSPG